MAPWIAKAFRACYAFSMRRVAISHAGQYAGLATLLLAAIWILWTELRPPATAANQPRHSIAITAWSPFQVGPRTRMQAGPS
jgi:hypothetical protein